MKKFILLFVLSGCSRPAPVAQPVAEPVGEELVVKVGQPESAKPDPVAEIRALSVEPKRVAPSGKASVVHLARGKNAYLGQLEMEAGAKVPLHRDQTEEYIYFLQGGGTIFIDGVKTPVSVGSAVYMPANAEVKYENGPSKSVVVQIFAGPSPAEKYKTWQIVGE